MNPKTRKRAAVALVMVHGVSIAAVPEMDAPSTIREWLALPPHHQSDEPAYDQARLNTQQPAAEVRFREFRPFVETNSAPLRRRVAGRANAFAGPSDLFAA